MEHLANKYDSFSSYTSAPFSGVALCTVDRELDLSDTLVRPPPIPPPPTDEAADGNLGGVGD